MVSSQLVSFVIVGLKKPIHFIQIGPLKKPNFHFILIHLISSYDSVARLSALWGPNGSDWCDGGAENGAPPGAAPPPLQPDQPHRPAQLLQLCRPRPQPEEAGAPPVRRGGRRQRAQAAPRAPGQDQRRQIGGGHRERGGAENLAVHGGGPVREPAGEGEAPKAAAERRRQPPRRPRRGHALPRPLQKRLRPRVDRAQQGDPRPHRCLALRPGACLEQWPPVPVAAAGGHSHGADEAHQHQGSQVQFDRALRPPNVRPQLGQGDC